MKKIFFAAFLLLLSMVTFAQSIEQVEMADKFRADGKIYVVIGVLSIVFAGIVIFLFRIDRKLTRLEKKEGLN